MRPTFGIGHSWRQVLRQTRFELSEVLFSAPFLTLLAFGLMFVTAYSFSAGRFEDMPSYPLTHLMLRAIQLGIRLTLMLILIFYAGELMFSQRSLKIAEVFDALPVPSWIFLAAKVLAGFSLVGVFLMLSSIATILTQLGRGFTAIDLGLYARGLLILAAPLLLLVVLLIFLQVLANHKFLGLLLIVAVISLRFALPRLGFEDPLYLFGQHPPLLYSDLNGYGHQISSFFAYMIYWSFAALIVLPFSLLFWPRGSQQPFSERLVGARQRLTRSVLMFFAIGGLGLLIAGAGIFHQTHVRNEYLNRDGLTKKLADYELNYVKYRDLPLPRVTSVFAEIDLFPDARQAEIRGRYRLENQGTQPVRTLPITISPRWVEGVLPVYGGVSLAAVDLPPHRASITDSRLGFHLFELDEPLLPGASLDFGFTVRVDHSAFTHRRANNLLIANGTFFSNHNFLPFVGYARSNQLQNPLERQKYELGPVTRMARIDDQTAQARNYLEADWVEFEAIVSTRSDQIAIVPGDLIADWSEGERRFFHYRTAAPIINLFPILSGRYEVRKEEWQGVDLEIYFHPEHDFNIDHFFEVTRKSLTYMSKHFGPYTHDQLRIVEIPNHHGQIAFAFAQTIAYSEAWAFTSDLDAAPLDWLAAVLAHEVAHQWWNYQVVPADVQGSTLIAESLAQYAAMMILEEMYGIEKVRHFLKFHLDRYLERRGEERVREMPLSLVENQSYLHYSKASLVFYALEDLIGEDAMNQALRTFLEKNAFHGAPYPTTRELLEHLHQAAPVEQKNLIEDLFATITLFDNRLVSASYTEREDGTFLVNVKTSTRKLHDDGWGRINEMPIDDLIDIGIFGEEEIDGETRETILLFEKKHLQSTDNNLTFVVDQKPARVGIDPYHKLIDRDSSDNIRPLREKARR